MEAFVDGIYHYKNRSDEAVAALLARGVELMDTPKGTTWRVAD